MPRTGRIGYILSGLTGHSLHGWSPGMDALIGPSHRSICSIVLLLPLLSLFGCGNPAAAPEDAAPQPSDRHFDPMAGGALHGNVLWKGTLPEVLPIEYLPLQVGEPRFGGKLVMDNPNAPIIDPTSGGVAEAVIFLRGIKPHQAKPWDHPPVVVLIEDFKYQVQQGGRAVHHGFVRQGDDVRMESKQRVHHSLHAEGASFFTLSFPDPNASRARRLTEKGMVELTSGAGYYWMREYLFVADHPYFTRTDRQGRFELSQVPAGKYEVVCWLPSWLIKNKISDPDIPAFKRLEFRSPVEISQEVHIEAGKEWTVNFTISAESFRP